MGQMTDHTEDPIVLIGVHNFHVGSDTAPKAFHLFQCRAVGFARRRQNTETPHKEIFARRFRAEMRQPAPSHLLDALAALSHQADFALGCYCADEQHCHRSVLRELLAKRGARLRRT